MDIFDTERLFFENFFQDTGTNNLPIDTRSLKILRLDQGTSESRIINIELSIGFGTVGPMDLSRIFIYTI
jgi:hypothetical protein